MDIVDSEIMTKGIGWLRVERIKRKRQGLAILTGLNVTAQV